MKEDIKNVLIIAIITFALLMNCPLIKKPECNNNKHNYVYEECGKVLKNNDK